MGREPVRLAIATWGISHFEVPMFRLLAESPNVDLHVFYLLDPGRNREYDPDYAQGIEWGEAMLTGFSSTLLEDPRMLRATIRAWRPDAVMVYGYGWPGALRMIAEFRARRIPLIFRGTLNTYVDPRRGVLSRLTRRVRPAVFHCFRTLHYGGTYSLRVLRSAGIPESRLFFVPYSVDTPYFAEKADSRGEGARKGFLQDRGWPADARVVLFIGQLSWFKGPDIAMEAFRLWSERDPRGRLVIVGSGAEAESLRDAAATLPAPDRVHFAGFCPSKQTTDYYLLSDVVLFTSRYETWARAVNEAMLCRRPCIVNIRIPASGGLVDDKLTGLVITGDGPAEYCGALEHFFGLSPLERLQIGEAARVRAMTFSYEAHLPELLDSTYAAAGRPLAGNAGRAG